MRHRFAVFAALVAVGSLAAGCSSGLTEREAAEQFREANPDASAEQADCVVDALVERYDLDGLERELEREANTESFQEAQLRAMLGCGMVGDLVADLEAQLVEGGVPADAAPCVAEELVGDLDETDLDVLLTGEITDEFYLDYLAAREACGVLNE